MRKNGNSRHEPARFTFFNAQKSLLLSGNPVYMTTWSFFAIFDKIFNGYEKFTAPFETFNECATMELKS
jgi:hypothetical protein